MTDPTALPTIDARLQKVHDLLTGSDNTSLNREDILAYRQLLAKCSEECLVLAPERAGRDGSLPSETIRRARMTVVLLRVASVQKPEIFLTNSFEIVGVEEDGGAPRGGGDGPATGPVLLSQLYSDKGSLIACEPFDRWIFSRVVRVLALSGLATVHEAVFEVVNELVYIMIHGRESSQDRHFHDLVEEMVEMINVIQSSLKSTGDVSSPITCEHDGGHIQLSTADECHMFLRNLYQLLKLCYKQGQFATGNVNARLWGHLIDYFEFLPDEEGMGSLKTALGLVFAMHKLTDELHLISKRRILDVLIKALWSLFPDGEAQTFVPAEMDEELQLLLATALSQCLNGGIVSGTLLHVFAPVRMLVGLPVFRALTRNLRSVLMELYELGLMSMELNGSPRTFIRVSRSVDGQRSSLGADQMEGVSGTAGSRKRKAGDMEAKRGGQTDALRDISSSKRRRTSDDSAMQSFASHEPFPEVLPRLDVASLASADETANAALAKAIATHPWHAADAETAIFALASAWEAVPAAAHVNLDELQKLVSTSFTHAISILHGVSVPNTSLDVILSIATTLCTCVPVLRRLGESERYSLVWVVSLPWLNAILKREPGVTGDDYFRSESEAFMKTLYNGFDFSGNDLRHVEFKDLEPIPSPLDVKLSVKCLRAIVSAVKRSPDPQLAVHAAYVWLRCLEWNPSMENAASRFTWDIIAFLDHGTDTQTVFVKHLCWLAQNRPQTQGGISSCLGTMCCALVQSEVDRPGRGEETRTCPQCDTKRDIDSFALVNASYANLFMRFMFLADTGSPESRVLFFRSLLRLCRHLPMNKLEFRSSDLVRACVQALAADCRRVRRIAGEVVALICTRVEACDDPALTADNNLALTEELKKLRGASPPVVETTVVTIGRIARVVGETSLLPLLQALFDHFGAENANIRSMAAEQVQSIAEGRDKSFAQLIAPLRRPISIYMIGKWESDPRICRTFLPLYGMTGQDFVQQNLQHILPHLVVEQASDGIRQIAIMVKTPPDRMLLNEGGTILPFIFMQDGDSAATLHFYLKMISQHVGIADVVRSYSLRIIINICMELGDCDPTVLGKAESALKTVSQILHGGPESDDRPEDVLIPNVLGILEHVNQTLLDVDGQNSVTEKCKTVHSLGQVIRLMNVEISPVIPQMLATLKTALDSAPLRDAALDAWRQFLEAVHPDSVRPMLNQVCVSLCKNCREFTGSQIATLVTMLEKFFTRLIYDEDWSVLSEIGLLPDTAEFAKLNGMLNTSRGSRSLPARITGLLKPLVEDNAAVCRQALQELVACVQAAGAEMNALVLSENVHDCIKETIRILLQVCRRYNGVDEEIQNLCCEALGVLGAIDPSRLNLLMTTEGVGQGLGPHGDFESMEQAIIFVIAVIESKLAPACRATHDTKIQINHAYAIQELLRFCGFTQEIAAMVDLRGPGGLPEATQHLGRLWFSFSPLARGTITPFLSTKYHQSLRSHTTYQPSYPIYARDESYRMWMQTWTVDLIKKAQGQLARQVFGMCKNVVIIGDINVAEHLLPHLVLNVLLAGTDAQRDDIRQEFLAILSDKNQRSRRMVEKRRLCCQTVFSLVDHIARWLRLRRLETAKRKASLGRRSRTAAAADEGNPNAQIFVERIEDFLGLIPESVMAAASYDCQAYARALLHFEQHIRNERVNKEEDQLQELYAHLQQIYAHLDESDCIEGLSTMFRVSTLEQQIIEHENAGQWTGAQTCYELALQNDSTQLQNHIGLVNCLKNLGHMDTLLTHVHGSSTLHPEWASSLNSYAIEAAWSLGDWNLLESLLQKPHDKRFETSIGSLFDAVRNRDQSRFQSVLRQTRQVIAVDLAAASMDSYKRSYDSIIKLHMLYEMSSLFKSNGKGIADHEEHSDVFDIWDKRLKATVASFRVREPILNLRRILLQAYTFTKADRPTSTTSNSYTALGLKRGSLWLQSAKASRKAGHFQAAYSAILHATRLQVPEVPLEMAKLLWDQHEKQKAMSELRSSLQILERESASIKHTEPIVVDADGGSTHAQSCRFLRAKIQLQLSNWIEETSTGHATSIIEGFTQVTKDMPDWEKAAFHLGRYYDKLYEMDLAKMKLPDRVSQASLSQHATLSFAVCRQYGRALTYGTRYIYQTLPRLLTIWLEMGYVPGTGDENENSSKDPRVARFHQISRLVRKLIEKVPAYHFLTAIPQLASRIGHTNVLVHQVLEAILVNVLCVYPQQTLWQLLAVGRSSSKIRAERVSLVFSKAKVNPLNRHGYQGSIPELIQEGQSLSGHLLDLCNLSVPRNESTISLNKHLRRLCSLVPLRIIIPLQSTMTVTLPTAGQTGPHTPFPQDAPTVMGFRDEIEIMNSLQRPRKLTIIGSDGKEYLFLCKPKDDLRKDCRLMEFNLMINKLLKKDPDARKRNLYIRTYAVVPLNEECGLIEWVPNTMGFRHIMLSAYKMKNMYCFPNEVKQIVDRKHPSPEEVFETMLKPRFPPVFHEWFLETFPEPTQWLASRLAYSATMAAMSMVGFVVGLGDRHGENILFDARTGDCVHVDLNCLFEKGLTFEKPEKVPFRLTHNMVDAFGVTGVEGVFRKSCEATMRVLRANRDSLMSVLETFLYDPLCEWNKPGRRPSAVAGKTDERGDGENEQAKKTLEIISRKLQGYATNSTMPPMILPLSPEGQVHELIEQATSIKNLAAMYIGWTAYM
ncbi:uncharacterized protein EV422DRAFT_536978 [Fimicolochytrium jonesii]|uniref:uncharacterized protein n=1 Tax=Fimicolochytrium jonesii TaxID=1396493 RepID=UPI0022FDD492|nr:uncharacterized protein EV422DRAFT_536978 [Fimicolochytrium jonesii]KAI8818829.1 hypothetical protein EV422DRAFT_536978 [Fimicolochytrium jonesii]